MFVPRTATVPAASPDREGSNALRLLRLHSGRLASLIKDYIKRKAEDQAREVARVASVVSCVSPGKGKSTLKEVTCDEKLRVGCVIPPLAASGRGGELTKPTLSQQVCM